MTAADIGQGHDADQAGDKAPDLSVIVVTWNVAALALACIESIYRAAGQLSIDVIVIDNASADATVDQVRRRFPGALLIANPGNAGFARASNQGIKRSRGRNVMLLNPDTVVLEDALQRLVRHADEHPEIGVVGPALVSPNGMIQFVCARRFPRLFDWMAHYLYLDRLFPRSRLFGGLLMSFWDHRTSRPIEAVCGAGMLIPRRVIARLGLLDESHPMYLEDIDYCMRSARRGLTNYYLAEARILHYEAQSSRQMRAAAAVLGMEAHRLFFSRYGGAMRAALFRALVLAAQLVRLPASLIAYGLRKIDRESVVREWRVLGWALGQEKR